GTQYINALSYVFVPLDFTENNMINISLLTPLALFSVPLDFKPLLPISNLSAMLGKRFRNNFFWFTAFGLL
ncbi:hypothetical protein, partial [Vibrio aestuarianus]|uniref:hypothetical protein n=1 Tax=Vibrio aestuarianus TaxID=28171 RepID=UPI001C209A02